MDKEKDEKTINYRMMAGGLCLTAGLFIGMGLGFAFDHLVAGLFTGLGAGFLAFGLIVAFKKN